MTDIYQEKMTKLASELAGIIKATKNPTENPLETAKTVIRTFNNYLSNNDTYSVPLKEFIKAVVEKETLKYLPDIDENILKETNDKVKQMIEELKNGDYLIKDLETEQKVSPTEKFEKSLVDCLE